MEEGGRGDLRSFVGMGRGWGCWGMSCSSWDWCLEVMEYSWGWVEVGGDGVMADVGFLVSSRKMGKVEVVFLLEEIRVQVFILRVCVPSICGLFNSDESSIRGMS